MSIWHKLKIILKLYTSFAIFNSILKVLKFLYNVYRYNKFTKHLPGENIDLTGGRLLSNVHRLNDFYHDVCIKNTQNRSKDLVRFPSPEPEIIANSPESVKFMLKDEFKVFTKASPEKDILFQMLNRFIGNGIFVLRHGIDVPKTEDKKWNSQRKTASKIFTKSNFNSMMASVFVKKGINFVNILNQVCSSNREISKIENNEKKHLLDVSKGINTVDMQAKFFSFTFDSIQKIFFDVDVNSIQKEYGDTYANAYDKAHRAMLLYLFETQTNHILSNALLPFPFGTLGFCEKIFPRHFSLLYQYTNYTSSNYKDFIEACDFLDKETYKRIQQVRSDPKLKSKKDMLSNFINADPNLDDKGLRDIMLNLIIAGRDTTACTLTWMFYEFGKHPEIQDKLYEELINVLGIEKINSPTMKDVDTNNLPYLNGCLYETLRLYGAVPQDVKIATRDVTFSDGTIIPKNTALTYSSYCLGRNPELWGKDCDEFKPERWIPFKEPDQFKMPTFQAGSRFCLGKDMAKMETKLLATMLLGNFSFAFAHNSSSSGTEEMLQPSKQEHTIKNNDRNKRLYRTITETDVPKKYHGYTNPENCTYALSLTMSLCDSKDQKSHHLYMVPKLRKH